MTTLKVSDSIPKDHILTCKLEDCNTRSWRRGYCHTHSRKLKAAGELPPLVFKDFVAAFWARVQPGESPNDCWTWLASVNTDGYGRLWVNGKHKSAHQVSFFIHTGRWATKWVLHHCDNPPCCNPRHLYEGTPKQNAQDMVRRGRQCPPELRKPRSYEKAVREVKKLTLKQQTDIVERFARGHFVWAIAQRFRVSEQAVKELAKEAGYRR